MTIEEKIKENTDIRLLKPAHELWLEVQSSLIKKFNKPGVTAWLKSIHFASLEKDQVNLAVKNDFMRSIIASNYLSAITEAFKRLAGEQISVKINIDPSLELIDSEPSMATIAVANQTVNNPSTERNKGSIQAPPINSVNGRSGLNHKYTFDTFVVGSHNRFCHSAALAVAEKPGQSYNPLFLYGGVGLGKTHLMQAIGQEVIKLFPNLSVRYITCERFTNELINSIRDDRMVEFRKRYRQVDVLLMDDIQFIQGKESTQEEFFHTFNALRDSCRQIVLSSDRPPKAISLLEERLRSRFEWGLIADIQTPDLETRMAILRKKCMFEKMHVPEDVIEHIANTFTTNIRELEGALLRVHAYSNMTGTELSIRALGNILAPVGPSNKKANITLESIIDAVSEHYRLEPSEIRSAKRSQDLALPRHIAMYLAHDLLQLSFPRIGQAFANRKHTSALYAHTRIKEAIVKVPAVGEAVNQIIRKLNK